MTNKWQSIKTAPINTPIIVTDGARQVMAMQRTSWVYNDPPLPSLTNLGQQTAGVNNGYVAKPFTPTHWHSLPAPPKVGK